MAKHLFEADGFDDLFVQVLWDINRAPQFVCSPRGSKIKENLSVTMILNNPRARLLSSKERNTNYGFGVGEFLWYWSGKNDLNTMLYYNKRMKDFSNDGVTLNSAYGHRMRKVYFFSNNQRGTGENQWDNCIQTLIQDPDTRRALLLINLPEDEREAVAMGSKDVPCTLSLQFFIRDGKLDLHVHMRSNDIMWGLTYDLFSFTLFQECMLLDLRKNEKFKDLELGKYYHTAGSLHIYERHFEQAESIIKEYGQTVHERNQKMEPIGDLQNLEKLCTYEAFLRNGRVDRIDSRMFEGALAWMAEELNKHRIKRDSEIK